MRQEQSFAGLAEAEQLLRRGHALGSHQRHPSY